MAFGPVLRCTALCAALALQSGCAAISAVSAAGEPLEAYELTPLPASSPAAGGRRHLIVEPVAVSGALATDRILIKPNPLAVEYLPGVRWIDEAGDHVQLLIARSLTNTGRLALVSTDQQRAEPDYYLLTDLQAFQAEMAGAPEGVTRVVVRARMTLVGDEEREILAARSFEQLVTVPSPAAADVIPGFERATTALLREAIPWVLRALG